ncbi:MAG: matrixin family metalloprotease [Acidimicrobiia bacterium]
MGVVGVLAARSLTVEPGGSGAVELTLRNDGASAARVRVQVGGPAGPFSYVVPDVLSVEPGGEAAVRVGFRLPRASIPPAGPLAFEVKLVDPSAPESRKASALASAPTVADGVLDVAPFSILSTTLDPPEASGTGPSRHEVCVGNRGNAPIRVDLAVPAADGLDVTVDPPVLTASPGTTARAVVEVRAGKRPFTGPDRELPFTVIATPEGAAPVQLAGKVVQKAAYATRTLVRSGVVAGVVVLALVVAAIAFTGGGDPSTSATAGTGTVPATAGANAACPAEGHVDRFGVNGLRPEDIPTLPNTYSFFRVRSDGCTPVRFNPCEPISYVQNVALAPPTGPDDVREAFARLSRATGMTFVDEGTTDEVARRGHSVVERYGERYAPILVSWTRFGNQGDDPAIQAVGRGIGSVVDDVIVSGQLSLNVDAVTDRDARTPVQGGFGPALGSGVGAIGPKEVTWGRIILHELAHVVGLGHTRDKGAIMYPETAEQTSRPAEFKQPDLEGLRFLGREAGCLTTPAWRTP